MSRPAAANPGIVVFLLLNVFARRAPQSGAGNVAGGKREARNPR
jgi:hypothetical protein